MKSRIIHALLFGLIFSTVFTTISLFTPPVTKFKCDSQLFSSNLYFIGASKDYSDINIGKVNCGVYPYNEYIGFPMPTRIKENPPSGLRDVVRNPHWEYLPIGIVINLSAYWMVGATGFLIANLVLKRKSAKKLK